MTTPRKTTSAKKSAATKEPLRFSSGGANTGDTGPSGNTGFAAGGWVAGQVTELKASRIPKLAAGETTTEFWLTVVGIVAAVVLACFGKITGAEALGAATVAGTGYSVSRGLAKR